MDQKDCIEVDKKIGLKLNRIKGQIEGIQNMLTDKRDCIEVINQIQAIRAALSGVAQDILLVESQKCIKEKNTTKQIKDLELLVNKFFKIN